MLACEERRQRPGDTVLLQHRISEAPGWEIRGDALEVSGKLFSRYTFTGAEGGSLGERCLQQYFRFEKRS